MADFNKDDLADGGEVARFVQKQLAPWAAVDPATVHVKDFSAAGGARVYKVWHDTEVKPAAVIMKAEGDAGDDDEDEGHFDIQDDRSDAVAKVLESRDLAPPLLVHDPEGGWHIELFGGGGVSLDFNHFDPAVAPPEALAKLMAEFHATPTDWYEPFRKQMVAKWPILAGMPTVSPFWNGAAFGWENGLLFTGGKMNPQKHAAQQKIFEMMVETGVYKQLIFSECFYPTSMIASRIVTIHGDFKPNNLIDRSDKDGCMCIDYDFTHVSCVQQELAFAFAKWLGPKFQPYEFTFKFLTDYATAANAAGADLPTDAQSIEAAMLDAEIGTICNFDGLLFSGLSRQIPLLRGVAHPTPVGQDDGVASPTGPEIVTAIEGFIAKVRGSAELSADVIREGIVVVMYKEADADSPLGKWFAEMRSHGSLGSFGIYETEEKHKTMQATRAIRTPWFPL